MTIEDLGYRPWTGARRSGPFHWQVIAASGIRLAWRHIWLRRLLILAWFPAVYLGLAFFLYEQSLDNAPVWRPILHSAVRAFSDVIPIVDEATGSLGSRYEFWRSLLFVFLRYLQGALMIVVVGMLVPMLVTQDLRSKAYLLYFSHPLTTWGYLAGKGGVVVAYLALVTAVPGVALYVLAVSLSPDFSVVPATWDLPFRVLLASGLLMAVATSLALMFSSITVERRNASFGWFALWCVGWVAYRTLTQLGVPGRWWWLSLYHTIGKAQRLLFQIDSEGEGRWALILLVLLVIIALRIAHARILAPLRA